MPGPAARRSPSPSGESDETALRAEVEALRAELEDVREREKMYRFSAEARRSLAWAADPDGNMLAMSRVFRWLTGLEDEEALRRGWLDLVHPEDRDEWARRWQHSLRTGDPFEIEFRGMLKDGTSRWGLAKAVPVRDDQGRIVKWYGSADDIHEEREAALAQREAETRLRESEELHRFTIELTRQIVWSVEPDGTGLTMSPRFYEVTGMSAEDDPQRAVHPDDVDDVIDRWTASLETGIPYFHEFRLRTRNGDYRYFRLRAAPLRNAEGQTVRWYGMTEDIDDERQAERARHEVEERYRLAVQATNDAVWDYDLRAGAIDWSDNSAGIFGADRPIGRTTIKWWEDRIHPEDREKVALSLERAIELGESHWSSTYRFLKDDGSYAEIFDRGFIIHEPSGKPVRAVGAMADLTDRHHAEAEIRRMQNELIHVSRLSAMGAMASTLAHELNQPLAAVSNFLSGARRLAEKDKDSRPELVGALEAAASGAQRAGEIVRRLRELVSRGAASIQSEPLPKLIEEASVLAFVDAGLLGIRHRLELDPSALWVLADRVQIQQVLINLIRNAIEAMERSREREIIISTRAEAGWIEVSVADTGSGIAPEHLESLFSQFMTTKTGGMGIGLPISRTIVELHGGQIWAENRPEGGAVFRFTLPKAQPRKQKPK